MIRMDDYLSRRSVSRFLEAAVARSQGELDDEERLRGEALALQERAQAMARRKSANEDRAIGAGVRRLVAAIDKRKERA